MPATTILSNSPISLRTISNYISLVAWLFFGLFLTKPLWLKSISKIKHKTTKNVLFLSFAISAFSQFPLSVLLTVLLGTAEVGLFAIVARSVGIFGLFF